MVDDATMWETLNCLPDAVEHMIHGDPDEPDSVKAADAVRWAIAEIERLREERLTNEERVAIQLSLALEWPHTSEQWESLAGCVGPVCKVPAHKHKVAVRRFLARQPLPPGPEGDGNG
jgi:hypothetical protein